MRGGKRLGAGRKKGFAAKNAEEARRYLSERVQAEIGPITDALIAKAKKGDIVAIKELLDRAWGKTTSPVVSPFDRIAALKQSINEVKLRYGGTEPYKPSQTESIGPRRQPL